MEKIYGEKDLPTNIAIFVGALFFLYVYIRFDSDPYLGFVAFLSIFSLTKVLSGILIERYAERRKNILDKKYYSKLEKEVIAVFTTSGTCFLALSDLRDGKYEVDDSGLDSLIARGAIKFIDRGFGDGPTGFQLEKNIYRMFLD